MAGWPILANGSGLDSAENVGINENNIIIISDDDDDDDDGNDCKDDESNGSDVRLRVLFDEVLSLFIKAIGEKGIIRPLPAMLDSEEKPVDLLRLFNIVRAKGGYGSVSKKRLWGFVARELGFRVRCSASAKLVYVKYLIELERWLVGGGGKAGRHGGNFRLLSLELETEFRGLFNEAALPRLDDVENFGTITKDHGGSGDDRSVVSVVVELKGGNEKGKECKRKRECLSEMLKWLVEMAKLPNGRSFGGSSKSEVVDDGKEFFDQAIRAREVLLTRRRHVHSNNHDESSLSQKKLKMHPSMYEDVVARNHHSSERLRCSKRISNSPKSRTCPCCSSLLPVPNKLGQGTGEREAEPDDEDPEKDEEKQPPAAAAVSELSAMATESSPSEDEPAEKQVSVGPLFQAEIHEWDGPVYESDAKWLGTRIWSPLDNGDHECSIGKGRRGLCRCPFPGSGECVRFHIAEARMRLKLELGSVFFSWSFHRMGEEISLQWTTEEENRFKDVIRSNKSFGDWKTRWFIRKSRESLVSYYFNVFLVQKRSYQNRVTPKNIDSDDDEIEFGSIGGHYGNGSVEVLGGSGSEAVCVQNRQCADFEEMKSDSCSEPMQC